MRTFAQLLQSLATRTAEIARFRIAIVTQHQDEDEESEENIAHAWTEGSQSEEEVAKNATSQQGKQIEQGFSCGKKAENFLNCGECQHQEHPNGAQEKAQNERKSEGIERRVIVVKHPSFGHIMLNSCI